VTLSIALSIVARAAPVFVADDSALTSACGDQPCWSHYVAAVDLDGDGDLDLVFANTSADDLTSGTPEPLGIHLNHGSREFVIATATAGDYAANARQVAIGDIDRDGDPDLYVPDDSGGAGTILVNDGTARFTDESSTRLPKGFGALASAARYGDVDDDGDLDLLVTESYGLGQYRNLLARLLVNDGMGRFIDRTVWLPDGQAYGDDPNDIDLVDLDGDYDLDVVVSTYGGGSAAVWLNDGNGRFSAVDSGVLQRFARPSNPVACDVDRDGDRDLWFDDSYEGGGEQLLINVGGHFTNESKALVPYENVLDAGVSCVDFDQDADPDLIIWSRGVERIYANDGTGAFTIGAEEFGTLDDQTRWGDVGDLDGDGVLDVVMAEGGGESTGNLVYWGVGPVDQLVPVVPRPPFPGRVAPESETSLRFGVRDAVVTDHGPRLSRAFARADFGGGVTEVEAVFVGGDLFRAVLPGLPATGWSAQVELCAIDRAGNEGCSPPVEYSALGPPPTPETGGDTGTSPTGDTGGQDHDSGVSGMPADRPRPACSCATSLPLPAAGFGFLLLFVAKRRRSRDPRAWSRGLWPSSILRRAWSTHR